MRVSLGSLFQPKDPRAAQVEEQMLLGLERLSQAVAKQLPAARLPPGTHLQPGTGPFEPSGWSLGEKQ